MVVMGQLRLRSHWMDESWTNCSSVKFEGLGPYLRDCYMNIKELPEENVADRWRSEPPVVS
jgi:hypothetical protein